MKFTRLLGVAAASSAIALGSLFAAAPAVAKKVTIRVQSVIPAKADEVHMLKEFAKDVKDLTNGEVNIEVLPAGAVVGVKETLDAVDKGLVEGGFRLDPLLVGQAPGCHAVWFAGCWRRCWHR